MTGKLHTSKSFDYIGTHSYLYSKCIIQVYSYKSVKAERSV